MVPNKGSNRVNALIAFLLRLTEKAFAYEADI